MEFEDSINSTEALIFTFSRLLKQLCQRMEARNRATHTLTLSLSLDSADRFERTLRLPIPTRDSRILLKLLQLDLDGHRPPAPVTGVTLAAEPAPTRRTQGSLFRPLTPEPEALELTLARIGGLVGSENLGAVELLDTHRRDAFRIRHFIPPTETRGKPAAEARVSMALRIFRPALPAQVEMRHGLPSRISFAGRSGTIPTARGPWNSSGEWWRGQPWSREEWDVEIQTGQIRTLYRIYQDIRARTWYVDAIYD